MKDTTRHTGTSTFANRYKPTHQPKFAKELALSRHDKDKNFSFPTFLFFRQTHDQTQQTTDD